MAAALDPGHAGPKPSLAGHVPSELERHQNPQWCGFAPRPQPPPRHLSSQTYTPPPRPVDPSRYSNGVLDEDVRRRSQAMIDRLGPQRRGSGPPPDAPPHSRQQRQPLPPISSIVARPPPSVGAHALQGHSAGFALGPGQRTGVPPPPPLALASSIPDLVVWSRRRSSAISPRTVAVPASAAVAPLPPTPRSHAHAHHPPYPSPFRYYHPPHPPHPQQHRPSVVAQNRAVLLAGMPPSHAQTLRRSIVESDLDRLRRRHSSAVSASASASASTAVGLAAEQLDTKLRFAEARDSLRVYGAQYLGDAASADVFVHAVALRRTSDKSADGSGGSGDGGEDGQGRSETALTPPTTPTVLATASSSAAVPHKITVRARVVPREPHRRPFLLQRNFDLDELRATIPDKLPPPFPPPPASQQQQQHDRPRHPSEPRLSALSVGNHQHQHHQHQHQHYPHGRSLVAYRSRSVGGLRSEGPPIPRAARRSMLLDARGLPRSSQGVPIHLKYARYFLPVLAALLYSGHIKEGDTLDLPVPHPEAWPQTVAHVYAGAVEMTEPVRRNILYLGGRA